MAVLRGARQARRPDQHEVADESHDVEPAISLERMAQLNDREPARSQSVPTVLSID